MKTIFGIEARTLEEAKAAIDRALRPVWQRRHSDYYGGEYLRASIDGTNIILQRNWDGVDRSPIFDDADCDFIISVENGELSKSIDALKLINLKILQERKD